MSNNFLEKFTKDCESLLGNNLICLLLIGSAKNQDTTSFSDIDLVAIVRKIDFKQMEKIRQLLKSTDQLLDLSFLCWDEIPKNPNRFRLGSHGCYHLELILKKAKVLSGNNILTSMGKPSEINLKLSIFEKIIEYTWWTRRMFIESNRERSIEDNYKLNSRLIKMLRDLLYLSGSPGISNTPKKIVAELIKRHPCLVTPKEIEVLESLADLKSAYGAATNMSDDYFEIRFVIVNKIHKRANEIFRNINLLR